MRLMYYLPFGNNLIIFIKLAFTENKSMINMMIDTKIVLSPVQFCLIAYIQIVSLCVGGPNKILECPPHMIVQVQTINTPRTYM